MVVPEEVAGILGLNCGEGKASFGERNRPALIGAQDLSTVKENDGERVGQSAVDAGSNPIKSTDLYIDSSKNFNEDRDVYDSGEVIIKDPCSRGIQVNWDLVNSVVRARGDPVVYPGTKNSNGLGL